MKKTEYRKLSKRIPPEPFIQNGQVFYSEEDDSFAMWEDGIWKRYIRENIPNK